MKLTLALVLIGWTVQPMSAGTSCRSHQMGSTVYTKCDDGKPSTPSLSCRTYKIGSTTYTKCT